MTALPVATDQGIPLPEEPKVLLSGPIRILVVARQHAFILKRNVRVGTERLKRRRKAWRIRHDRDREARAA